MQSLDKLAHPLTFPVEVPPDNSKHDVFYKTRVFHEGLRNALWDNQVYMFERPILNSLNNRVLIRDHFTKEVREMIMMAGNDYLGLRDHPRLFEAAVKAMEKYGVGSAGSPILCGTIDLNLELEDRLARMYGCEACTLFTSGYAANVGIISSLTGEKDAVVNDTTNHASLIDGTRLSSAAFRTYRHNNLKHLEMVLQECQEEYEGTLVVIDSVFSMDGDIAPVPEIVALCRKYGARLMIDEAHSLGVLGKRGFGTLEYFGLEGQVDLVMGGMAKGLGSVGGFVCGPREVIHYLSLSGRARIFSSGLAAPHVAAALAALDVIEEEPERVAALWNNIHYMQTELRRLGYDIGPNPDCGIIPVMVRPSSLLWPFGKMLHDAGVFCNVIGYPAVAHDKTRIRLTLRATHTQADMDETISAFEKCGKALGLI